MKKLMLDLSELKVESFNLGQPERTLGGTIHAHDYTHDSVCTAKRLPGGDSNFDPGCEPGYTNDEPSCNNITCNFSCMPTQCDYSCAATCGEAATCAGAWTCYYDANGGTLCC